MFSTNPEKITLRGRETAYRFQNGEFLNAGRLSDRKSTISFAIAPDGENPASAEIFACGDFAVKLENLQLRILAGGNTFLHHARLLERRFNAVEISCDGELIKITVEYDKSIVISRAETLAGEVIFSASAPAHRFRGMIKDLCITAFDGKIEPETRMAVPDNTITFSGNFPQEISLDGEWDFFCTPKSFSPASPVPPANLFTAKMVIPGYWDDHYELLRETRSFDRSAKTNPRFRPLSFPMGELTPDASMPYLTGTGYYRKTLSFAPGTTPRAVTLHLGPAVWGSTVYCNGKLVSHQPGYSAGHSCRLEKFLDFQGINTLVIAVSNYDHVFDGNPRENSQHIGLAVRGFQGMRCGIAGKCFLQITGAAPITDAYARFDGKSLYLFAESDTSDAELYWNITGADGRIIRTANGKNAVVDAGNLHYWSDENPYLYEICVQLIRQGQKLDEFKFHYGLRRISCRGSQMILNGTPVYLRGLTEHHYFPETANAPYDREKYLLDIKTWQSYGFNFLRFHTWCPPEPYLDAADRCGMICQVEVPPHEDEQEWKRIMKYLRRHASVLIICGGNEEDFTGFRIEEVRQLAKISKEMIPEALFNPQEGLSKVEYRMLPDEPGVVTEPFIHNPEKFKALAEFSDCYGSYSWGYFSYIHTLFPGAAAVDARYAIYGKPVLSHEIGILGGWLDFNNEKKYAGCVVPGDFYAESRKVLQSRNIFDRAQEFYQFNSLAVNSQRKALLENIRQCKLISGYDLLGAYDAHWHRCGYPCGLLDEFNMPKYGVTPENIRQSNAATVLLCDADNYRAFEAGARFNQNILLSHYGKEPLKSGVLKWHFSAGNKVISGRTDIPEITPGTLVNIGECKFDLPATDIPVRATLRAEMIAGKEKVVNGWDFWIFPAVPAAKIPENCRVVRKLDDELVDFVRSGGNLLLTANFPAGKMVEKFQVVTTGRSAGHLGTIIHPHPLMENMAHNGFAEWQFFALLLDAVSMDFTGSELPFAPIIEYIPSFKRIRFKTPLCEYRIGKGRIIMCGLRFEKFDPAGKFLYAKIMEYLSAPADIPVPEVDAAVLKRLIRQEFPDSGSVKTDEAWDPNVSAGKQKKK